MAHEPTRAVVSQQRCSRGFAEMVDATGFVRVQHLTFVI
jgi:hypothetical protein